MNISVAGALLAQLLFLLWPSDTVSFRLSRFSARQAPLPFYKFEN